MEWYLIMLIVLVVVALIGGGLMAWYLSTHTQTTAKSKKKKTSTTRRGWLQGFYKRFPLIKNLYARTYNRLSALFPSDLATLHQKTTRTLTQAFAIAIAIILYGIATSNGNPIYIIAHVCIAYIGISLFVDVWLESMERQLVKSLRDVLPKIGKAYDKHKIVADSIYEVYLNINQDTSFSKKGVIKKSKLTTSKNAIMGYHLDRMYQVLTAPSSKIDVMTQQYISSSPNVYLTLLLSVCIQIQKKGDRGLAEGTGSSFKRQIYELQQLVNDTVLSSEAFYYRMKPLPFLTLLLSLPLIKPLEAFCYYVMPDLKANNFFNGAYGIILIALCFAVTIFCYTLIMRIKAPTQTTSAKLSLWYKLSEVKWVKKYVTAYQTKHFSKTEKLAKNLKKAGQRQSTKQFFTKKVAFAVLGFVFTLILCISGVVVEKIRAVPSYTNAFEKELLPNENYRHMMRAVSEDIALINGKKATDVETLTQMVIADGRIKDAGHAQAIANEIVAQNSAYKGIYFKFYYLIISLIVAVLAFYLPDFFLRKDLSMAKVNKSDEVNQFRSIISLMMEMGGVTTDDILMNMQKFARYYKEPISKALINLDKNETKALLELRNSEKEDDDFVDICDSLINIRRSGVVKSFETIKADKEFHRDNRKLEISEINASKISKAQLCWQIPFYATVILTLFIPLGISAIETLLTTGVF